MDGQGPTWVRTHLLALIRVGLLLVCGVVFAIVAYDLRQQRSHAAPYRAADEAAAEAEAVAKWNAAAKSWLRRERARADSDVRAVRRATVPPVLAGDLAGARSGDRFIAQKLAGMIPWQPSHSARGMIAIVETSIRSKYLVAFTRPSALEPWRVAVEVNLVGWPWGTDRPWAERRPVPFPVAVPLRALRSGRPMTRTAVAVPINDGRTIVCAGLRDGTRFPNQACVGVDDDRPDLPIALGMARW